MTLPRFMVIGAAKAGTTTLHSDLQSNPGIFLPEKQPAYLGSDRVLTPEGRERYERRFDGCSPTQLCGAVSTMCATRPQVDRVPERALALLGADLKVIYIVREPVERAISDHFDLARFGDATLAVDRELFTKSQFLDESRYHMQLEPWLETFGRENVMVIHFETYVKQRRATIASLSKWLGVEPHPELVDETRIENRGHEQLVRPWYGLWPPARRLARAVLPEALKQAIRRIAPPRRARRAVPTARTIERAHELLDPDTARFHRLLDLDEPLWGPGSRGSWESALVGPARLGASVVAGEVDDPVAVTPEPA